MRKSAEKNNWEKVKLSDIGEINMGQSPPSSSYNYNKEGLPFYQGVKDFGYKYPVPNVLCNAPKKIAQAGDILLSVRAPIGAVNVARDRCCIGRGLAALRHKEGNSKFLFYLMKYVQKRWSAFDSQGTVFGCISKEHISNFSVIVSKDSKYQQKIASILSAYDDLIELNERRIKVLEEIARLIYKEWFVKFKFPGYKKVKMVKSELGMIPEGWEVKSILDIGGVNLVKARVKKYDGVKEYFATANIDGIAIIKNGELVNYYERPSRAQMQPEENTIWFARMRETFKVLCFTSANKEIAEKSILSTGFAGLKVNKNILGFIYFTVNSKEFHEQKDQFCTGATQMSLTNDGSAMIKIVYSGEYLVRKYSELVSNTIDQIIILQRQNSTLRQTRDMLLPKLISGKIDVSNLDIRV